MSRPTIGNYTDFIMGGLVQRWGIEDGRVRCVRYNGIIRWFNHAKLKVLLGTVITLENNAIGNETRKAMDDLINN